MGLTSQSTGLNILREGLNIDRSSSEQLVIALAGNPNVGKSTVFNNLTGLNQHTGNWPGKTVANAQGKYRYKNRDFILVDIPGTYSLMASSVEEEVARDFICFGEPDAAIVVTDATCLERNLNLVLQILELTDNVVVCVNLLDEAGRKKIHVDLEGLAEQLGVPVVGTSAMTGRGLDELMEEVHKLTRRTKPAGGLKVKYDDVIEQAVQIIEPRIKMLFDSTLNSRWVAMKLLEGDPVLVASIRNYLKFELSIDESLADVLKNARRLLWKNGIGQEELRDKIVSGIVMCSEEIFRKTVRVDKARYNCIDERIDNIVTSGIFGIPVMIGLVSLVFWLTIQGANYPSELIAAFLFWIEDRLTDLFTWAGFPVWLNSLVVKGMYRTLAWVISVMLPPMAIFFPLFTLLEDLGYLPRIAFNLDNYFKKACAHGKQALTMCMGLGCNAAGIIGCRIIDSPRERLIATITNNFVPCNGRFPTIIALSAIFIGGAVPGPYRSLVSALVLTAVIVLGVSITLVVSKVLSMTLLKGIPSSFTLELPPYRRPRIGQIIVRSVLDRTLFVLGRAVSVAAPAGLVIWCMANIDVAGMSLLDHSAGLLSPFANIIGLDGYILMAFILGFPANEIVIPIIIMSYLSGGNLLEIDSLSSLRNLLVSHGWTWLTAVCMMLFSLMHFPCGTALWTIKKETGSLKWTAVSFLIPTLTGVTVCFVVAQTARMLGLV